MSVRGQKTLVATEVDTYTSEVWQTLRLEFAKFQD
jgi:hypothetical protein